MPTGDDERGSSPTRRRPEIDIRIRLFGSLLEMPLLSNLGLCFLSRPAGGARRARGPWAAAILVPARRVGQSYGVLGGDDVRLMPPVSGGVSAIVGSR